MSLDGDRRTVHLRCGSDIREGLERAGFAGDFLEFADPVCAGPLPDLRLEDYLDRRARWMAEAWDLEADEVRARGADEYAALDAVPQGVRLVLWFEHDPYDALVLARALERLSRRTRRPDLELILLEDWPEDSPDAENPETRFLGLGQLSPEGLQAAWATRRPVGDEVLAYGTAVWEALVQPGPENLEALAEGRPPPPPLLSAIPRALRRWLEERPDDDGLFLTQRLILEHLDEGPLRGGPLFRRVQTADPLPFLGDLMFGAILKELETADPPPVTRNGGGAWYEDSWLIAPEGRRILDGAAHLEDRGRPQEP